MGTLARRLTVMVFTVWTLALPGSSAAEEASPGGTVAEQPAITGGHDGRSVWLTAVYRDLHLAKRVDRGTRAIGIELTLAGDRVTISVSPGAVSVSRGGKTVSVDSPEGFMSVQRMLGDSFAVFATRAMLSQLESNSPLKAPDMSLLSVAAFVAALTGDVNAPRRLADRFVEKHRGIYRQVRGGATCWEGYTSESTDAWNDLQACMDEASNRDFFTAAYERLACNGTWLLRSESAWLEYLNCLSPLGPITQ